MKKILRIIIYLALIGYLGYRYGYPYFKTHNASEQVTNMYNNLLNDNVMWLTGDHSTLGTKIHYTVFGDSGSTTLIFGGFHGDEPGGVHLVLDLAKAIQKDPSLINKRVVLVPALNPDGLMKGTRVNSNKVDINRNFPTKNWSYAYKADRYYPGREAGSEKETHTAIWFIEHFKPEKIISIHSALHVVNYDGPAKALAELMSHHNGYDVSDNIGYSTPGSFGTYAGAELGIPTITLELPLYDPESSWADNKEALIKAINF